MENRNRFTHGSCGVICSIMLIALLSTSLFGQTPITFDADNKALLEKLHNIPLRVQHAVSDKQAERVAKVWLHLCPDLNPDDFSIGDSEPILDAEQTRPVGYVVHLKPQGFILLAADNEIRPIVGYSSTNNFSMDESCDNAGLSMVRTGLALHLAALQEGVVLYERIAQARALWQDYLAQIDAEGEVIGDGNYDTLDTWDVEVGPLLSSKWNQSTAWNGSAYETVWNYYTPPYASGNIDNYVCGCVATALSQILNYYEWPITGTGSHSYTWDNGEDPAQVLSADFGATTYDWSNTLDDYYYITTSEAQRQAAGLLSYHCGVAVDMNYASDGSGAFTSRVPASLKDYFRTSALWRTNDGPGFYDDVYNTVINERPGELSISGECGGHAIVCDGVHHNTGGTKYFHLNMGWGGYSDGWFDITDDFVAGGCTWSSIGGCAIQIIPAPDLNDPGTTVSTTTFPVDWQVATLTDADNYELQQSFVPTTLGNIFDGAEAGGDNWSVSGDWEVSSAKKYTGSYSFRGFVGTVGYSTMQLTNAVRIDATTSMTYNWGINYQINAHVHLQVSNDGSNWTTLKTYDQSDNDGGINWYTENSIDLSSYSGETIYIQFVYDYQGGGYYSGIDYNFVGFFLDDISITNCAMAEDWLTVDATISAESYSVTVTQDGDYNYRVRAFADGSWRTWSDVENIKVLQPPSTQATDISCTEVGVGTMDITWTRGNGDGSMVFAREGSTGEASPVDNTHYAAHAEFGSGDQIGTSGWYCVYDGTGTSVTVTGLQENTDYRIHVCEYKLGSIIYNKNSSSGNPSNTQEPIAVDLTSLVALYANGKIQLEWTTASEVDVAGYNILAGKKAAASFIKLNSSLIKAKGSVANGQTYSYVDAVKLQAERWYKLETINLDGSRDVSEPVSISYGTLVEQGLLPTEFALHQNYPNPFNPKTTIQFDLPAQSNVTLVIYDMQGRIVRTLVNGVRNIGVHNVVWDGTSDSGLSVSSGLYLYRIRTEQFNQIQKMTLLK